MAPAAAAASDPWAATYALNAPRPAQATRTYPLPVPPEAQAAGPVPDILERPRDKTRASEVDLSALQFLFAEMVAYAQTRVSGIAEFERLLSAMGARVGHRALVLLVHRKETSANPKKPRRETRLLPTLLWLHTAFWKAVFGMQADSLERSTESGRNDEFMISTNNPLFTRGISIPKEMAQLSVEAFAAGIVEGALDALGFPARVTAHGVPTDAHPNRTTILIKLERSVMEREAALGGS
ncbi:Trafficking protein particle complex subunit 31 [Malassezia brasiliensis]|uniref:Trafficking protein particle complex subunit n=1 Tax=Malassezia brasiliensis TaxID=1821822 RepID=A0AAF0DQC6_9BASI|nr:Trafficking protein particle complex subunit 31 [Malassezia brasiliensis]